MPSRTLCVLFAEPENLRFESRRIQTTRSVEDGIPTGDRGNEWMLTEYREHATRNPAYREVILGPFLWAGCLHRIEQGLRQPSGGRGEVAMDLVGGSGLGLVLGHHDDEHDGPAAGFLGPA
jgi:hypothetical protein